MRQSQFAMSNALQSKDCRQHGHNELFLFMFKVKLIRIPSAGVGGLCVGIFSSLQGLVCVYVLCSLQCAKNTVGSVGKVIDVCICVGYSIRCHITYVLVNRRILLIFSELSCGIDFHCFMLVFAPHKLMNRCCDNIRLKTYKMIINYPSPNI